MPVGNSLDIINTSNHLSAQREGRVQARAQLPQEALAAILPPLPKGLGKGSQALQLLEAECGQGRDVGKEAAYSYLWPPG